jgi:hypothetical protein
MQPFPPVDVVRLLYQDKVRAELARQRPESHSSPDLTATRSLRSRIGHVLVAIGLRIDPTAPQVMRPGSG